MAGGRNSVVIASGGRLTVMESAFVEVCAVLSVTFTVKFHVPAAVGVPVMDPTIDMVSPGGSDPTLMDHKYGDTPPAAVKTSE